MPDRPYFNSGEVQSATVVVSGDVDIDPKAMAKSVAEGMKSIANAAGKEFGSDLTKEIDNALKGLNSKSEAFTKTFKDQTGQINKALTGELRNINLNKILDPLFEVFSNPEKKLGQSLPILRDVLQQLQIIQKMPRERLDLFSSLNSKAQTKALKDWTAIIQLQEEARKAQEEAEKKARSKADQNGPTIGGLRRAYSSSKNEDYINAASDKAIGKMAKNMGITLDKDINEKNKKQLQSMSQLNAIMGDLNTQYQTQEAQASAGDSKAAMQQIDLGKKMETVSTEANSLWSQLKQVFQLDGVDITSINKLFGANQASGRTNRGVGLTSNAVKIDYQSKIDKMTQDLVDYMVSRAQANLDKRIGKVTTFTSGNGGSGGTGGGSGNGTGDGNISSQAQADLEARAADAKNRQEQAEQLVKALSSGEANVTSLPQNMVDYLNKQQKWVQQTNKSFPQDTFDKFSLGGIKPEQLFEEAKTVFGEDFQSTLQQFENWIKYMRSIFNQASFSSKTGQVIGGVKNVTFGKENTIRGHFLTEAVNRPYHENFGELSYDNIMLSGEEINTDALEAAKQAAEDARVAYEAAKQEVIEFRTALESVQDVSEIGAGDSLEEGSGTGDASAAELDAAYDRIETLKQDNEAKEHQMADLEQQIYDAESDAYHLKEENAKLRDDLSEAQQHQADMSSVDIDSENKEVGGLEGSLDKIIQKIRDKNQAFKDEQTVVKETVDAEVQKQDELLTKIQSIADAIKNEPWASILDFNIDEQVNALRTKLQDLKSRLSDDTKLDLSVTISEESVNSLNAQLDEQKQKIKQYSDDINTLLSFKPNIADLSDEDKSKLDSLVQQIKQKQSDSINGIDQTPLINQLNTLSGKLQSKVNITGGNDQNLTINTTAPPELSEIRNILQSIAKVLGADINIGNETKEFVKTILQIAEAQRMSESNGGSQIERAFGFNMASGKTGNTHFTGKETSVSGHTIDDALESVFKLIGEKADSQFHSHPNAKHAAASIASRGDNGRISGDLLSYLNYLKEGIQHQFIGTEQETQYINVERLNEELSRLAKEWGMSIRNTLVKLNDMVTTEARNFRDKELIPGIRYQDYTEFSSADAERFAKGKISYQNGRANLNQLIAVTEKYYEDFSEALAEEQRFNADAFDPKNVNLIGHAADDFIKEFVDSQFPENLDTGEVDVKNLFQNQQDEWLASGKLNQTGDKTFDLIDSKTGEVLISDFDALLGNVLTQRINRTEEDIIKQYNVDADVVEDSGKRWQFAFRTAQERIFRSLGLDESVTEWFTPEQLQQRFGGGTINQANAPAGENFVTAFGNKLDKIITSLNDISKAVSAISGAITHGDQQSLADSSTISSSSDDLQAISGEIQQILEIFSGETAIRQVFSPSLDEIRQQQEGLKQDFINGNISKLEFTLGLENIATQLNQQQEQIAGWLVQEQSLIESWFQGLIQSLSVKVNGKQLQEAIISSINQTLDAKIPTNNKGGQKKDRNAQVKELVNQIQEYINTKPVYAHIVPKQVKNFPSLLNKAIKEALKENTYQVSIKPKVEKPRSGQANSSSSGGKPKKTEEEKEAERARKQEEQALKKRQERLKKISSEGIDLSPLDPFKNTKYTENVIKEANDLRDGIENEFRQLDFSSPTEENLKNIEKYIQDVQNRLKQFRERNLSNPDSIRASFGTSKVANNLYGQMESFLQRNSSMSQGYKDAIRELQRQLRSITNEGDIKRISTEFSRLRMDIIKAGQTGISFADRFKRKLKEVAAYVATYVSFQRQVDVFRQGFQYIRQFDSALTEMMKVSNETETTLRRFQKTSFDQAASVGTTAVQIQNSTADFMRLGESLEEAAQSAVTANKLLAVSEFSNITEATEALTSMSQAYKEQDKDAIVDVVNELGNNYAISTNGVATALQLSASALRTAQNDLYEASALVTAGNAVVQDPDKVGAGLRTIALRLTGTSAAKAELQELGEDVDDFVMTTSSKLDAKIRGLTQVITENGEKMSVSLLDANGNYRSTYEILQDIAKVWKQIGEEDKLTGENRQNALLELIAGKNRSNIAASILENPELLQQAYSSALNSEGSADVELNKYLDSIEGHINQVQTRWQELWDGANNRDFINGILEAAEAVLKLINNLGMVKSLLAGLTIGGGLRALINTFQGKGVFSNLTALTEMQKTVNTVTDTTEKAGALFNGLTLNQGAFEQLKNIQSDTSDAEKTAIILQSRYNSKQRDILQSQQGINASIQDGNGSYVITNGQVDALNIKLQAMQLSLKGLIVAHPIASMVTGLVAVAGVALWAIISQHKKAQKQIEETRKSAEAQTSTLKEFQNSANQNQSTISSLSKRFDQQSKGVDDLGRNIALNDEEYQEYLDTCKQIASIAPDQVSYYNEQGNAIVRLKNGVKDLSAAYKESLAADAASFLMNGTEDGVKVGDIKQNYTNNNSEFASQRLDFFEQQGNLESETEFTAYISALQAQMQKDWDGWEATQLDWLREALNNAGITAWDPFVTAYDSGQVDFSAIRQVVAAAESTFIRAQKESDAQVTTVLRNSLMMQIDTLSPEVYQLSSSIIENQSSGSIKSIMDNDQLLSFMPRLANRLTNQAKNGDEFKQLQEAITFSALSPDIPVSELNVLQKQYQDILVELFKDLLPENIVTQMFGLDASEQFERNVEKAIENMSKDIDLGHMPLPGEDQQAERALAARLTEEFANLGIDTQNELSSFLYVWNSTWDATKQNWWEVIESYLNRRVEETKFDWAANKDKIDEIQSSISELGTMTTNVLTNQRSPEVMIDAMQTMSAAGIDLNEYETIGDAFLAYQGKLWDDYEKQLLDIDAPKEVIELIRTMFKGATDLTVFDQVGELEKSLGNIQSAYDTVTGAMEEYNQYGFLTMGTIDSLIALDDSYINAQVDENGVLQYNEEAFKRVALAKLDEAKAAVWKETTTRLDEIAMMDSTYAANELAKANGTLADSAYAAAKAAYYKAAAISNEHRLLANNVMNAANKRVALLDQQIGAVTQGVYDFGAASGSAASSSESSFGELFDFFERRIDVLTHALNLLEKNGENLEGSLAKNNLLEQNTAILKEELNNYEDALGMYSTAANFYFEQQDAEMKEKILNGAIDLHALIGENGEAVNDLLKSYVEWQDKAQECKEKLVELRKELAQLELNKFKNIQQDFADQFDIFQGGIDTIDDQIALAEEAGELVGKAFYEEQRREALAQLELTNEQYIALQEQMKKSLDSGLVEEGSEEWLEMAKALQETQQQALGTEKQIVALNKAMRQLKWDTFSRTMDDYDNLNTELENLGDLFNDETDIEVSDGFLNWTEAATAQLGTMVQRYETSKESIFAYQRAIEQLNQEYANGEWSTIEYNEKLWELRQGQWKAVESCEALEDAIMDMNEKAVNEAIDRINDEIEAYQEQTDAQKDALQAEKDLHDWQKKLSESNKNISDLERQIAAMQNDNTASTVAKRKQLEEQLAEARADLEEEEYQHSIDAQQDALDKQMSDYQKNREKEIEELEEMQKDRTKLIQAVFDWVIKNAFNIGQSLEQIAQANGVNISTYITDPWKNGTTALGNYNTILTESISAWAGILQSIAEGETALQEQANAASQAITEENAASQNSVWLLSEQLKNSWTDANNLNEMLKAIADSSFKALERGFNADNVVSALRAIEDAASKAGDAIRRARTEQINFNNEKQTVDYPTTPAPVVVETQRQSGSQSRNNTRLVMQKYAKGGLISKDDSGTFDALARAVGEDTMIAARYGESVLTPLQTEAMIKMAPFLETIASQLPDFSKAGKVGVPSVGSSSSNRSVQIGSLVTINGNVDDNNLKQIQQTVQTELRKSFNKINLDFKYA